MNASRRPWFPLCIGLPLTALLVVGCGDGDGGTGPGEIDTADLPGTAAAVEDASARFFTDNEGVRSVNRMSPFIASAGLVVSPGDLIALVNPARFRESAEAALSTARSSLAAGRVLAAITPELIGKTLVFDPETESYVVDEERTGAPADGVRFILYEGDPETDEVALPLVEIGHVDIVDTSTESEIDVALEAVVDGETVIDIGTNITSTETSADIASDGSISDGTELFEYALSVAAMGDEQQGTITGAVDISTTTDIVIDVDVEVSGSLESETGSGSASVAIQHDGHTVTYAAELDDQGNITGEVSIDGDVLALIDVDLEAEELAITDAGGGELSAQELEALERVLEAAGEAGLAAAGLLFLALALAGLSLI